MQVASAEAGDAGVRLTLLPSKGDATEETLAADVVLVSTGALCQPRAGSCTSPEHRFAQH